MSENGTVAPIIVSSENGRKGILAAIEDLRRSGSALDAVEIACRVVEDDPDEHSVGYSGLPNLTGDVELDASIMDGKTLCSGAVAAVHEYGNPISLARQVMERLPHVLLVGAGAERFAAEVGAQKSVQLTETARARWQKRFADHGLQSDQIDQLIDYVNQLTRPLNLRDQPVQQGNSPLSPEQHGKDDTLGTVNFLALDRNGNLASAVSTSGLGWKYPGRVGDSPIIGAGNYCDNRYGAVACTGMGELAIRASTARSLLLYMKMGLSLHDAGLETLNDLMNLYAEPNQYMNIVSLTPQGEHAGFSTVPGKKYLYMSENMEQPGLVERVCVE